MALAIAAALLSGDDPVPVQVDVTGLTVGVAFTVTGSAAGWEWTVQGGDGTVATATQHVLVDVMTPLNEAITYTVTHGASSASSGAVTVDFDGDAAIVALDGETVASIWWVDNGDPRKIESRHEFFTPAGSSSPVVHYDVASAETGTVVAETSGADTTNLRAMLLAGAPVVLRTDVGVRDLDPVQVVAITSPDRVLVGAAGTLRRWNLGFTAVRDTDDSPLVMATLADVNTVMSGDDLGDVNTDWSGLYLSDMNAYDWQA